MLIDESITMNRLPFIPTTTITMGETVFDVSKMTPDVQDMVTYLDQWRSDEQALISELLKVRSAMRELQTSLHNTLQEQLRQASVVSAAQSSNTPEAPHD